MADEKARHWKGSLSDKYMSLSRKRGVFRVALAMGGGGCEEYNKHEPGQIVSDILTIWKSIVRVTGSGYRRVEIHQELI